MCIKIKEVFDVIDMRHHAILHTGWAKKTRPRFFFTVFFTQTVLNLVLTTPPHLKYVTTLPCNLSLMASFVDTNGSRGSAATYATRGGIFNIRLTANLLMNLAVKKILKPVKI